MTFESWHVVMSELQGERDRLATLERHLRTTDASPLDSEPWKRGDATRLKRFNVENAIDALRLVWSEAQ
jgi:hypothetical protein